MIYWDFGWHWKPPVGSGSVSRPRPLIDHDDPIKRRHSVHAYACTLVNSSILLL